MEKQEPGDSDVSRKPTIERLSKEELIKKYRQAILIAQKAKESKAEFLKHIAQQEELVRSLEEKLRKCENEKLSDADLRGQMEVKLKNATEALESQERLMPKNDPLHLHDSLEEKHRSEIEMCNLQYSKLESELQSVKETVKAQESELIGMKDDFARVSDLKNQLEMTLEAKDNETKILKDTISSEKETYEKCQKELHSELHEKQCLLEESHEKIRKLVCQVEELEKEQGEQVLNDKMNTLILENTRLEEEIKRRDEENCRKEESISHMSLDLLEMKNELEQFKELSAESSSKVNLLLSENNSLSEKISSLETEKEKLNCELEENKRVLQELSREDEVSKLTVENAKVLQDLEGKNEEILCKENSISQLSSELQRLKGDMDQLTLLLSESSAQINLLQSENSHFSEKILTLETEKENLNCKLEENRNDEVNRLTAANTGLLQDIAEKNEEIQLRENTISELSSELQRLKSDMDEMTLVSSQSSFKIDELQNIISQKEELEGTFREQVERLQSDLSNKENILQSEKKTSSQLQSEIKLLKNSMQGQDSDHSVKTLTEEKTKLEVEIIERDEKIKRLEETIVQLKAQLSALKADFDSSENNKADLIHQLTNEKKKLEESEKEITENGQKYSEAVQHQQELKEKLSITEGALRDKELLIQELEQEVLKLKDAATEESTNTEISSTFSFSRAEELSRMKDLEDTFEDKYTKLRVVAVKLKRRVTDLTQTLESERSKMASEKSELQSKLAQYASHAKTVQTLQSEVDRLQDLLEEQKKTQHQLSKDLELAVKEAASKKIELASVQEDLQLIKNEKKSLEVSMSSLESNLSQTEAMRTEIDKLRKDLKEKDALLELNREEKQKLSEQLEKVSVDVKKKSVLSLEMADMEKSVSELTRQLSSERHSLMKTESDLEQKCSLLQQLESKLMKLEEKIKKEEESNQELKAMLSAAKGESGNLNSQCKEKDAVIAQLSSQLETERSHIEELNIQCSDLAAKHVQSEESSRHQIEALSRQVFQLEEQCCSLKDSHKTLEDELASVRTEFENYKVRAQSVLRQSTKQDDRGISSSIVHNAEELEVEVERLRVNVSSLKENLKQTMSQLQAAQQEVNVERDEKTRAMKQAQSLKESVAQAIERQHAAEERLSVVMEELKQSKLHSDMLVQCYKLQLDDLKSTHQKKVLSLTEQLENLQASITNPVPALSESDPTSSAPLQSGPSPVAEWAKQLQNAPHAEREEGEGSESVDSFPSRRISVTTQDRRHELVPLDKLLSSTSYPEEDTRGAARSNSSDLNVDLLQSKLSACELRAAHLTALLSEAESDAARLSQLNAVLKEEIRRQQRSEERAQHAHNLEYLKNVVVKFITLQNGDERQRLVPVLNTILKLSPEEAGLVESAAKGSSQASAAGRGWGSYLPLPGWTGS